METTTAPRGTRTPTRAGRAHVVGRSLVFAFLASLALAAEPTAFFSGKCIAVKDGDTIDVLKGTETITVRLEGIDAPEKGQEHGAKAGEALAGWIKGKDIRIGVTGKDQYGRTLGVVYLADVDINSRLLAEGWAWHFKKYNSDKKLAALETAAREAKKGLWQHDAPIPPWEYRALKNRPAQVNEFWLNVSSGVRHNSTCKHYGNTKGGRKCSADEGKPCGICGG